MIIDNSREIIKKIIMDYNNFAVYNTDQILIVMIKMDIMKTRICVQSVMAKGY